MYSKQPGGISWIDLTVENATEVRDFYANVIGMEHAGMPMGDYEDFVLTTKADPEMAVGVCHARGPNKDLPAQWLMYFNVDDVDKALSACELMGGEVLRAKTDMGGFEMAVIRDPAGAVAGVIKAKPEKDA